MSSTVQVCIHCYSKIRNGHGGMLCMGNTNSTRYANYWYLTPDKESGVGKRLVERAKDPAEGRVL